VVSNFNCHGTYGGIPDCRGGVGKNKYCQCCRGDTIVPNVVLFLPFGTVVLHLNLLQILVHFN
jgi:hypothetical protein